MRNLFTILFLFNVLFSHSQVNLHFFEKEIPQSNFINPALIPSCKVIIGIPALNGITAQVSHNGFTFNQLFDIENNSYVLNIQNAIDKMGNRNYMNANLDLSILFIGIKRKGIYYNFAVRERVFTDLFYNKDLLKLAVEGNSAFEGEYAKLNGTGLNMNYFRQYSFGASFFASSELTLGLHLNFLFGKVNALLLPSPTSLYTNPDTYALTASTNSTLKLSSPILLNERFRYENANTDARSFILNRENKGITIDLGFDYQYSSDLNIYGSIIDLGFIRYKSNISHITAEGEFTYEGPNLSEDNPNAYFDELLNSLNTLIDVEHTEKPYTYFIPTRLYLGANKQITSNFQTGLLTGVKAYKMKLKTYFGLHAAYNLGKVFTPMVSWSYSNRSFKNLGAGFTINLNPFNFYLTTDNILGYFWWRDTKNVNLQLGFNLKFGCKQKTVRNNDGCSWSHYPKSYQQYIK